MKNLFTDTETTIASIDCLLNLDLSNINYDDFQKIYDSHFQAVFTISAIAKGGINFFRARINNKMELFDDILELGPPPKHLLNSLGRANKPNQQVFYCSESPLTSTLEVLHHTDFFKTETTFEYYITVSEWVLKNENDKMEIAMVIDSPNVHNKSTRFMKGSELNFNPFYNGDNSGKKPPIEFTNSFHALMTYFSNEFSKPIITHPRQYIPSTFYFNRTTNHGESKVNGVLYPTIANLYKDNNYAFTYSSYYDMLKPRVCQLWHCSHFKYDKTKFVVRPLKVGMVKAGKICWNNSNHKPFLVDKIPIEFYI